ncbi:MAG: hypothetical protein Kow0027_31610 [Saprospiraceae bacterium]
MENPSNCLNCGHPLHMEDQYCPQCGQKNKSSFVSVREFLGDFFDQLFNLNNRIFRTLAALMLPGKLTADYFAGRRQPFYHPLRIFIVAAAVMLTVATLLLKNSDLEQMDRLWEKEKVTFYEKQAYNQVDSLNRILKTEFPNTSVAAALDSLKDRFAVGKNILSPDSIEVAAGLIFSNLKGTNARRTVKVAGKDALEMREKDLANKYGLTGFWERLFFVQNIRILKAGDEVVYYALGNVIWMMLLMMPLLALALKLLYIRRGHYLVEHLVFALHTHSFVFILVTVAFLVGMLTSPDVVALWSVVITALYVLLAMKRYYRQGWIKTLIKYSLASFMYFFLFSVAMLLTSVVSMLLF